MPEIAAVAPQIETHDAARLAALLHDALYREYAAALAVRTPPTIEEPPVAWTRPAMGVSEYETVYYIAGYVLSRVSKTLAKGDDSLGAWCRDFVACCSLPPKKAAELDLPVGKVRAKDKGSLIHANREFFAFIISIELIYLYNLTNEKLFAYPSILPAKISACVHKSEEPRRIMREVVVPVMPLDQHDATVPEEVYSLMYSKYSMMRAKDVAKMLHRAHASARDTDASASGVTHRANMEVAVANARKKAKGSSL